MFSRSITDRACICLIASKKINLFARQCGKKHRKILRGPFVRFFAHEIRLPDSPNFVSNSAAVRIGPNSRPHLWFGDWHPPTTCCPSAPIRSQDLTRHLKYPQEKTGQRVSPTRGDPLSTICVCLPQLQHSGVG